MKVSTMRTWDWGLGLVESVISPIDLGFGAG